MDKTDLSQLISDNVRIEISQGKRQRKVFKRYEGLIPSGYETEIDMDDADNHNEVISHF